MNKNNLTYFSTVVIPEIITWRMERFSSLSDESEQSTRQLLNDIQVLTSLGQQALADATLLDFQEPPVVDVKPKKKSKKETSYPDPDKVARLLKRTPLEASPTPEGRLLRKLRVEAGLNIREMARRVHIHDVTVSRIERGTYPTSLAVAQKIAKRFDVDINDLITPDDQRHLRVDTAEQNRKAHKKQERKATENAPDISAFGTSSDGDRFRE